MDLPFCIKIDRPEVATAAGRFAFINGAFNWSKFNYYAGSKISRLKLKVVASFKFLRPKLFYLAGLVE
jgi:hypothetical protein